jgi:putative endonuclease
MTRFGSAKEGIFFINMAPGFGWQAMYYVYILQSLSFANQRYIGYSTDLKQRLSDHNSGKSPHTSKYIPWKLVMYIAFEDELKALAFERYLKSGSGHAFYKKHF